MTYHLARSGDTWCSFYQLVHLVWSRAYFEGQKSQLKRSKELMINVITKYGQWAQDIG